MTTIKKIQYFLQKHLYTIFLFCTVAGLIIYPIEYLLYAYLYYYCFFLPIYTTFHHEYLMHGFLKPKNKFIEYLSFFLFTAYGSTLRNQRQYHLRHHKFADVNPHLDPTFLRFHSAGTINYLLGIGGNRYSTMSFSNFTDDDHRGIVDKTAWDFFVKHNTTIHFSFMAVWLILLPLWTWITFYVYPIIIGFIAGRFTDLYYHKWSGKDNALLIFLQCNQGWHRTHHVAHQDKRLNWEPWDYEGSAISKNWKYVNSQYYMQKFYKPVIKTQIT